MDFNLKSSFGARRLSVRKKNALKEILFHKNAVILVLDSRRWVWYLTVNKYLHKNALNIFSVVKIYFRAIEAFGWSRLDHPATTKLSANARYVKKRSSIRIFVWKFMLCKLNHKFEIVTYVCINTNFSHARSLR